VSSRTPTSRTLEECKKRGWKAQVVEKWIPRMNVRKDVFGFGDVLVLDGKPGSLLVQACRGADSSTRTTKILEACAEDARSWLEAGNRIQVWGWAQRGPRGKRKLWGVRVVAIELSSDENIYACDICGGEKEGAEGWCPEGARMLAASAEKRLQAKEVA
jgi:hypothetical protein